MAVTKPQADDLAQPRAAASKGTKTDDNVEKPSTVQPGDAPADTTDPNERVSSVPVRPGVEAVRAGTVNAVLMNDNLPTPAAVTGEGGRVERYEAVKPDGSKVTVELNLETGESRVV